MLRWRAALAGLVLTLTCGAAAGGTPSAAAQPARSGVAQNALTPQLDFLPNVVNGVACPPGGPCVAVGYYFNGTRDLALAESLVDGSWQVVPIPDAGSSTDALNAVWCASSGTCVRSATTTTGKLTKP